MQINGFKFDANKWFQILIQINGFNLDANKWFQI